MAEDLNDNTSPSGKRVPDSLDEHLRALLPDKDLNRFRDQLPSEFLSDATEGLSDLKDESQLESVLRKLNQDMRQQLGHKKPGKKRRSIADMSWTYWAIIIILLLAVLGYFIISLKLKRF